MTSARYPRSRGLPTDLLTRGLAFMTRTGSFAAVGLLAFVVDLGVYNALRFTILEDKPIGAKVVSVAVATVVAWLGNRYLTFRDARTRPVLQEAALFALANVFGLAAAAACLFVSHYLLGLTSALADNISGNAVGLVIGTVVRYIAYRYFVFRPSPPPAEATIPEPLVAHRSRP